MKIRDRVEALRAQMRSRGLSAYLVPSAGPLLSEYVPECWQRWAFISGVTASAGDVLITRDDAGLWTDGRYFLQAERELRDSGIELFRTGTPGVQLRLQSTNLVDQGWKERPDLPAAAVQVRPYWEAGSGALLH